MAFPGIIAALMAALGGGGTAAGGGALAGAELGAGMGAGLGAGGTAAMASAPTATLSGTTLGTGAAAPAVQGLSVGSGGGGAKGAMQGLGKLLGMDDSKQDDASGAVQPETKTQEPQFQMPNSSLVGMPGLSGGDSGSQADSTLEVIMALLRSALPQAGVPDGNTPPPAQKG